MRSSNLVCSTRPYRLPAILAHIVLLTLGSQSATAQPDLVINVTDSLVKAGACDKSSNLAFGRIAVKNIGTSKAKMDSITRPILVIYVPENISMRDEKTRTDTLDAYDLNAFDQESIAFQLGAGSNKRGRFFGTPPDRVSTVNQQPARRVLDARKRAAAIQRALNKLGHDAGKPDGVIGRQTREAVGRYQVSIEAASTGTLTDQQIERLLSEANVDENELATGAQGRFTVTLYAAVDPYDLVEESNEANNIVKFTITLDCSR